jgi:hypothetical protein
MVSPAPEDKEGNLKAAKEARDHAKRTMELIGYLPDSYKRTAARAAAEETIAYLERVMDDFE